MAEPEVQRRLAAIVCADVVAYTRLMEQDEAGTHARLRARFKTLVNPMIGEHGGRVVKLMGDGLLAEFPSVVNAVNWAVEVQAKVAELSAAEPDETRIEYRVGVNLGDIIVDGDDIYGDGVNVAARLQEIAERGGVCISEKVQTEVRGKLNVEFVDSGAQTVKNVSDPLRIWRWSPGQVEASDTALRPLAGEPLALPDKPSIAVLPFDNMSGDPEQEYFADGVAEDIITSLSKLSQLLVIARNSSFIYKGRAVKVQEIAEELGVRYVVEGSVRKAGNRVRISAQLIDCATGGHLWAERFDRELTDIFAVQDEVTQEIVSAMALKLTADDQRRLEHEGKGTDNLQAYDHFLRGREQHWLISKEGNAQAKVMLTQAIELDPEFAPAYAFLSEAHVLDYINRWDPTAERPLEQAYELAQKAVTLDAAYPRAHGALGQAGLWMRQHDQALAEYERSVALDPNHSRGHIGLGNVLHYAGRSEEGIEPMHLGMRLDPHYPPHYLHFLAQAYFQLGRYEEAIDILKRRLIRVPGTDISRVLLAASYGHLGRIAEAKAEWTEALRVNPDYSLEHRRQVLPYKDPSDFDRLVEGLRKAGLPK